MGQIAIKCLGKASTVGELKKILEKYTDDTFFGFRNQPMQKLFEISSDGEIFIVFQEEQYIKTSRTFDHFFKCDCCGHKLPIEYESETDGYCVLCRPITKEGGKNTHNLG